MYISVEVTVVVRVSVEGCALVLLLALGVVSARLRGTHSKLQINIVEW